MVPSVCPQANIIYHGESEESYKELREWGIDMDAIMQKLYDQGD
jgi:hypothetical protein